MLYVGLSRARDDVWMLKVPDLARWRKDPKSGDRWVRSPWREQWKTLGFELRAEDFEGIRPFGRGLVGSDPAKTQDYLGSRVCRGDSVDLELVHVRESEEPVPFYAARHGVTRIAETTEYFGRLLGRRLGSNEKRRWPAKIVGASIDCVETVAGSSTEGKASDLGVSGLWLRPRVLGLADLLWHETNDGENELMADLDEHYRFREELSERLEQDLLGPSSPDEILVDFPLERYIVGVLYPQAADQVDPSQDDDDKRR